MPSDNKIEFEGIVEAALGNSMFRVSLSNTEEAVFVLCGIAGKMHKFNIRITEGDKVRIEVDAYDTSKGRIVRRL